MLKKFLDHLYGASILLVLAAGLVVAPVSAQKLYKWVDDEGNVTYQDQPPPENARVLSEYAAPGEERDETPRALVTLYSVPQCDACDLVRFLLQRNSVPYTEKNPSSDAAAANELKQKSGQLSVPSLTVGDKLLMGYNSLAIRDELKNAGYQLSGETSETAREVAAEQGSPEQAPPAAEETQVAAPETPAPESSAQ